MSIRLRLTLWYSGILAVTLILFSTIVYSVANSALHSEIRDSLQVKVTEIINNSYETAPLLFNLPISRFTNPDTYIQVLSVDQDGKLKFNGSSTNLGDERLPMDQALLAEALQHHPTFQDAYIEGVHLQQYNRAVFPKDLPRSRNIDPNDMKPVGVIQVARSLEPIDNTLRQLRAILVVASACSIALAGIIGWLMANAALAPVARITQEAQEIGQEEDLNRRVAQPKVMDEAGRLAAPFNDMLSRLQASIERQKATLIAQRRFVADASHELRTPLTTIRGNVALLQRMVTHAHAVPDGLLSVHTHDNDTGGIAIREPEQLEALDDIAAEAERMTRLVNDMLTLARADAGQQLTRIPVNLHAPIEEVYRHAGRLRDERNPAIKMGLEADEDITVLGDPDALRQLFLILIDNALKYTPGEGLVRIRLSREADQAVLHVSDTGIGISAEDLPFIFERFYRADRARGQGGTGLGLAIAKWIAEEHGGRLTATSTPGEGSTFTLVLPAQPA